MAATVNLLNVPNEILQKNVLAYCAKEELYNLSQVRLWKTFCNYGENKLLCLPSQPHFIVISHCPLGPGYTLRK